MVDSSTKLDNTGQQQKSDEHDGEHVNSTYREDNDIIDENIYTDTFDPVVLKNNILDEEEGYLQNKGKGGDNLAKLIIEELAEPELMNFCKDNQRAIDLIKMCISLINSKEWTTMKSYLADSVDISCYDTNDKEETCLFYVKNFYLGVANFKLGDYEISLSCFNEAIKIHNYFQINYNIALCYIKLEKYENAVYYLEKVTKSNKNYFFAYYNLIRIYLKKANINDAYLLYRDFSDLIKKDKEKLKKDITGKNRLSQASFNTLKLFYKLGAECCFAKSLYQECVLTILEALKFNPEDPGKI